MSAQIIDGKGIANRLQQELAEQLRYRQQQQLVIPGLAVILVGEDPASAIYVRNKRLACQNVGIHSVAYDLPLTTTQAELLNLIDNLNQDPAIHGILVQLPLPVHIDSNIILDAITPTKDVDGFHPYNLGRLAQKRPLLRPCTPYGIITLLEKTGISISGLHSVVVGASNIVGKPMALELLLAGSTVTICHSKTKDLASHVKQAELLVAAIGQAGIIKTEWIKPGAIVIDVGMNRSSFTGKLTGDIDFETAKEVASWITPVPGGVGPMTVTSLLYNTVLAATLAPNPSVLEAQKSETL